MRSHRSKIRRAQMIRWVGSGPIEDQQTYRKLRRAPIRYSYLRISEGSCSVLDQDGELCGGVGYLEMRGTYDRRWAAPGTADHLIGRVRHQLCEKHVRALLGSETATGSVEETEIATFLETIGAQLAAA